MDPRESQACSHCGRVAEKLLRCSRCHQASYCNAECQRSAWRSHKAACAKAVAAPREGAPGALPAPAASPAPGAGGQAAAPTEPAGGETVRGKHALPPLLPAGAVPRLVGVLSSHIGDGNRLRRLEKCFSSIQGQTLRPSALYVVWSAPEEIAAGVESLLGRLRGALAPSPVHALRQTRRTSQFYDIRWLHDELLGKEPADAWLLFTDDDDLWGPERVRTYVTVIKAHASSPNVTAVCATHKVRPTSRTTVALSADEVSQHLSSGDAKHCGGVHVEEEFFDFSCPRYSLSAFLGLCNDDTLLHPFADLRFTRFMSEYYAGGRVMYFPTDGKNPWVYYYSTAYRRPEDHETFEQFQAQDQASTVIRVRPEDKEEAKELCRQACGGRPPMQHEFDDMLDLVSSLRQNIEGMLIRHFPEDPLTLGEMKRIAVGQCQGQPIAVRICERLARDSCKRFGVQLV